jgi:hypothetical protein
MQNNAFSSGRASRRDVLIGAAATTLASALPTLAWPPSDQTIPPLTSQTTDQ